MLTRKETETMDRLIPEDHRRKTGAFYTPAIWVDEAHKEIAKAFGEDWKENYIVWDNSCGTANLTRDYKFKELYLSTIEDSDLDTIRKMGYNPEATVFHFDFLNDDFAKLPDGLRKAIEETPERIIVLMNPPYGEAKGLGGKVGKIGQGATTTLASDEMKKEKWGRPASELYAQFFYRCWKFGVNVAVFSKTNYMAMGSYEAFRKKFFQKYRHETGFTFKASHFSGTAKGWMIAFNVWKRGTDERTEWTLDVRDTDKSGNITTVGRKVVYNLDGKKPITEWIDSPKSGKSGVKLSSALKVKVTKFGSFMPEDALGTLVANGSRAGKNAQGVYFLSGGNTADARYFVSSENFLKCCGHFAARRLIISTPLNDKDEYLCPNESHSKYQRFLNDSVVYSLFNPASQQSSLRQVEYDGKVYDIKNEFFWMSRSEMAELATQHSFPELKSDAESSQERYLYLWLNEHRSELSQTVLALLDEATSIVVDTFPHRREVHVARPDLHLHAWDAGYVQLKRLAEVSGMKARLIHHAKLYKQLAEELRPLVYELGFLRSQ